MHTTYPDSIPSANTCHTPLPSDPLKRLEYRALLDEADREAALLAPPVCNTGVQSSTDPEQATNAGIDWLEMTHDATDWRVVCDLTGWAESEWQELTRGSHGYVSGHVLYGVRIWHGGREDMGVHVVISGQACRELEARGVVTDWCNFLKAATDDKGWRVTRVDLFRDDREGVIGTAECYAKVRRGEVVTRASKWAHLDQGPVGGESQGETVNIGAASSDTKVRIYDKAAQLCPKDGVERDAWLREHGPHVRVEAQLRRERAKKAVDLLKERGFGGGVIGGVINAHVEFKQAKAEGHNAGRVPVWDAWLKVLGSPEKIVLAAKVAREGLLGAQHRLERQWGPTIAALMALHGGKTEWVKRIAAGSFKRVKAKHVRMLEEADRHLEECESCRVRFALG